MVKLQNLIIGIILGIRVGLMIQQGIEDDNQNEYNYISISYLRYIQLSNNQLPVQYQHQLHVLEKKSLDTWYNVPASYYFMTQSNSIKKNNFVVIYLFSKVMINRKLRQIYSNNNDLIKQEFCLKGFLFLKILNNVRHGQTQRQQLKESRRKKPK